MPGAPRKPAGGPELDELRQATKLKFEDDTWTAEDLHAFDAWLKELDTDVQIFRE